MKKELLNMYLLRAGSYWAFLISMIGLMFTFAINELQGNIEAGYAIFVFIIALQFIGIIISEIGIKRALQK